MIDWKSYLTPSWRPWDRNQRVMVQVHPAGPTYQVIKMKWFLDLKKKSIIRDAETQRILFTTSSRDLGFWADWMPYPIGIKIEQILFKLFRCNSCRCDASIPIFHILNGFISGIPWCCNFSYSVLKRDGTYLNQKHKAGYVVCPYCDRRHRFKTVPTYQV